MANTSNAKISTNLNVAPYYDDFDEFKNYHRILYKPGFAVQGRELTQAQTLLQNQIDKMGKHFFKEGSIVIPGGFSIESSIQKNAPYYVKVKDVDASGNQVDIQTFNFKTLRGLSSGVTAQVRLVADGTENDTVTKTLIVAFVTASDINQIQKTFLPGEILVCDVGSLIILGSEDAVGKSSLFRIEEGVVFAKGHFISFPTQIVALNIYDDNPTCKVGFFIDESIINSDQDSTLLDPALESSNYSAPGADRLKLYPRLTVLQIDDATSSPDFVTLFTIKNGVIETLYERTEYNILQDELAKRTFDESGDYFVRGLDLVVREHLDDGNNLGVVPSANGGNASLLSVAVEPGLAYVKGYEVGTLTPQYLVTEKGLATTSVNNQLSSAIQGSYITVDEVVGAWQLDRGTLFDLYDTAQNRISERKWATSAQTGSKIGTARLQSIEYVSGTPGYDAKYNLYLSDVRMIGTNNFTTVKSVYYNNSLNADACADIVLNTSGQAILNSINESALLYYVGSNSTKSLRSPDNPSTSDMTFSFNRTEGISTTVEISTDGTLTLSASGDELFPYGTVSNLPNADKRDIVLSFDEAFNIALPGTALSASNNTLVGDGTSFTRLNVGDKIELSSNSLTYQVVSIANNTHLTVNANLPAIGSNTIFKAYKIGDHIDLTGVGVASGVARTVTTTSTTMIIDLKETYDSSISATVSYRLTRTSALEVPKTLKPDRIVKINVAAATSTSGPFNLGFSDVFRVKKIVRGTDSYPSSMSDGVDVTNQYSVDNGQRDNFYDHASITPLGTSSATDRLLVQLDYFEPVLSTRFGYYSIDSYPIDDFGSANTTINTEEIPFYKSPVSGREYDLRNHIDFRPIKTNSATDTTVVASASENPVVSTNFNIAATGMRMPVPSSQISYDYSYYMGRKDLVVVNQNKNFSIIRGVPSLNPVTPTAPENVMVLAVLTISPYPSLSPSYAQKINRNDLSSSSKKTASVRHTMRDIGVLKDRIVNLEYYTTLSLLEKSALDLKVLDENGLDRFKNGVFVDTFNSHALGATYNPDYRIVVDPEEKSIRPIYNMNSFYYDILNGSNVKVHEETGIVTLDYTEALLLEQTNVTTIRNTERTTWRFLGRMTLDPETDVWVDTQYAPDNSVTFNLDRNIIREDYTELSGGISTQWNAWQTKITGYAIYTGTGTNLTKIGSYNTRSEADRAAQELRSSRDVTVETIFQNSRSGTQNFLSIATNNKSIGEKVIDTELIPYIRPQVIHIKVQGMKPYAKMFVHFDRFPMSKYCRPLTAEQYNSEISTESTSNVAEGSDLIVDLNGNLFFSLRLPSDKKFTVGTKEIIVSDSPTNSSDDATSVATGYFVSQGLVQTKQETIISTRQPILKQKTFSQSQTSSSFEKLPALPPPPPPPTTTTTPRPTTTAPPPTTTTPRPTVSSTTTPRPTTTRTPTPTTSFILPTVPTWTPPPPTPIITTTTPVTTTVSFTPPTSPPVTFTTTPPTTSPTTTERPCTPIPGEGGGGCVEDNGRGVCIAYSFRVKAPNDPETGTEGVFLTSVDTFFAAKHPTLGAWFEIREMNNAGQITENQIPLSEVWYTNDEIAISTNGIDNPTTVRFKAPIFLQNDVQYAFVIHPEAGNPNYYMWAARIGETDINTGLAINSRSFTGTTYTTNNNANWDIVADLDLTLKFYRASFNIGSGSLTIGNKPVEKLRISGMSADFNRYGEILKTGDKLTLTDITGGSIANTDLIVGETSGFTSAVNYVDGIYSMSGTGYDPTENVTVQFANTTSKGVTARISDLTNGIAVLDKYIPDINTSYMTLVRSNGNFRENDTIIDVSTNNTATINVLENFRYSVVDFEPGYLAFRRTGLNWEMKSYSNNAVEGSFVQILSSDNYYFEDERALFSRSYENANFGGAQSNQVRATLSTSSEYVSPVIDLQRTHSIYVNSLINNDATGEANTSGGNLYNKYISKTITLADGQDAEDIKIALTSYRPPTSDVRVWVKILNAEDGDTISQKPWIELEKTGTGNVLYSSLADSNDFKEFTYDFPDSMIDPETKAVKYTNSQNIEFSGYKYYAVKIGLMGTNSAVVPRVADLRVIALQA